MREIQPYLVNARLGRAKFPLQCVLGRLPVANHLGLRFWAIHQAKGLGLLVERKLCGVRGDGRCFRRVLCCLTKELGGCLKVKILPGKRNRLGLADVGVGPGAQGCHARLGGFHRRENCHFMQTRLQPKVDWSLRFPRRWRQFQTAVHRHRHHVSGEGDAHGAVFFLHQLPVPDHAVRRSGIRFAHGDIPRQFCRIRLGHRFTGFCQLRYLRPFLVPGVIALKHALFHLAE